MYNFILSLGIKLRIEYVDVFVVMYYKFYAAKIYIQIFNMSIQGRNFIVIENTTKCNSKYYDILEEK